VNPEAARATVEPLISAALYAQAGATAVMFGLIWFVQVVHYPMLRHLGGSEGAFREAMATHQQRTTLIVAPAMLVEALAAVLLAWASVSGLVSAGLAWAGVGLLCVVWGSTFLVQVPMHVRLSRGRDERVLGLLVATNWVRTIAWTGRMGVALAMLGSRA
jgi:hypothetical protein